MQHDTITIVLATSNNDKVRELKPLLETLPARCHVVSSAELGIVQDIEETEQTLEGNAQLKAQSIFSLLSGKYPSLIAIGDDTGLEVEALDGAPGVYSARYAPTAPDQKPTYQDNVRHLLAQMEGCSNRRAAFRCVIAMKGRISGTNGPIHFEEHTAGIITGTIAHHPAGTGGFGYDPLFIPDGSSKSFAEMESEEKNLISHRAKAIAATISILERKLETASRTTATPTEPSATA